MRIGHQLVLGFALGILFMLAVGFALRQPVEHGCWPYRTRYDLVGANGWRLTHVQRDAGIACFERPLLRLP